MRAGAERAVSARRREGVGRVSSEEGDEVVDGENFVAKRSNAVRMEASVEALMRCCLAREEGGFSLGRGKREVEGGGGGARERRLGGWDGGSVRLLCTTSFAWAGGNEGIGKGIIPGTHHAAELWDERDQWSVRLSERRGPIWPRHCGARRDFVPTFCGVKPELATGKAVYP